ncbi:hypothetical protein Tco_1292714 [Tanacetum coccineum]
MCPELVSTESKKIEKYIRGFPERIKGNNTFSKPTTLHEAINIARELVEQSVQGRAARIALAEGRGYARNLQKFNRCNSHHNGQCPPKYGKCGRLGHEEKDCQVRFPDAGGNCFAVKSCCWSLGRWGHTRTGVLREGTLQMRELIDLVREFHQLRSPERKITERPRLELDTGIFEFTAHAIWADERPAIFHGLNEHAFCKRNLDKTSIVFIGRHLNLLKVR